MNFLQESMMYYVYEMKRALMDSTHRVASVAERSIGDHFLANAPVFRSALAANIWLERLTRRFEKPEFDITSTTDVAGREIAVDEIVLLEKPFCRLLHFRKKTTHPGPKILVVSPMAGHFATLLRDTVAGLLHEHDVYVTDWLSARDVPLSDGVFNLDTYMEYLLEFFQKLGPHLHVLAVCQPTVPVMAVTAYMAQNKMDRQPASMILMGGPVDTREGVTQVDVYAKSKPLEWFDLNLMTTVPSVYKGVGRRVCPGFVMLRGFMSLHPGRHARSQMEFLNHILLSDDEKKVDHHVKFYDEYRSVMDLSADYLLDCIKRVFQEHQLPLKKFKWRGQTIDCDAIYHTALMTVEGEKDDISGPGQTAAAHKMCANIPEDHKVYHLQEGVGHYGIFSGSRWREKIVPKIHAFVTKAQKWDRTTGY